MRVQLNSRLVLVLAVLLVAAGIAFAWLLSSGSSPSAGPPRQPSGQTASRPVAASETASVITTRTAGRPLPATESVQLDLVLRQRSGALDRYLHGLFDPSSALYGHYLSPAQYGERFGIGPARVRALERRLRALGLDVRQTYPQETLIDVTATAAVIRHDFGVTLRSYTGLHGQRYFKPNRAPRIPGSLAGAVTTISGLDTDLVTQTEVLPASSGGAIQPIDAQIGYDVKPLYESANGGLVGQGQTIGVIGIDGFSMSSFEHYSHDLKLGGPTPQTVVLSKPSVATPIEGDLDLETIHGIAPGAQIIDYQTSFGDLPSSIMDIVNAHKATIISGSFGACDGTKRDPFQLPTAFRQAVEKALAAAVASGITFLFSTGDAGAYDCQRMFPKDSNLTVEFPADAPYTLAVGGTVLSLNSDDTYASEAAWGDASTNSGGGGGLNPYDPAPSWEYDIPGYSTGGRQTPDVSAAAGLASPWWVYTGQSGNGWTQVGGTSAAAPFWAGSLLLIQQYMEQQKAGPLCFATPLLYEIADQSWKYPPFHDVALGDNLYYSAVTGWDFATGLGSPDVFNLATAIVSYRQSHPLAGGTCQG
jgi:subtilase family serine protease